MAIGRISGQMLKANLLRSGTDLAFETNLLVLDVTNSYVGVGTASPARKLHISDTGALRLPSGTDAQRGTSANGDIRYNSERSILEGYIAGAWRSLPSTGGTAFSLADSDGNTGIDVERTTDENQIHFYVEGLGDVAHIRSNGNIELNNLQISNQTITGLSTNTDITITPNGTGQVAMTSVDIAGGEIDGTVIGANSAAAGTFTTVDTSGNVTVGGNLIVNGSTTTIESTTLSIEDPLLILAKNNSGGNANTYDQGILFNRGSFSNVSFFWDESLDEFAFATTSAETGSTAGNITIDSYQKLHAGIIVAGTSLDTGAIKALDGTAAITIASSTGVITASTNLNASAGVDIDADNQSFTVGAAADFTITHDGTNTTLDNNTGVLRILGAAGSSIKLNAPCEDVDTQISGDVIVPLFYVDASADKIGIATSTPSYILDINSTDAVRLPQGNTAARPTAATGVIRFNTQTGSYEGSQDGSTWVSFVTTDGTTPAISKLSATGDGSTSIFTSFFAATPASAANVLVFIDNVHQEPTENYTISGTTLTFTSAPHPGARIYALVGFDYGAGGSGPTNILTTVTKDAGSSTGTIALDLTKLVNKIIPQTSGDNDQYTLADGIEGQIMYIVAGGDLSSEYTSMKFANARYRNTSGNIVEASNVAFWLPFGGNLTGESQNTAYNTSVTLIFTDGYWNLPHSIFD
jgi:hypothetical protein